MTVKLQELAALVEELTQKNSSVWIQVTGNSMYPFLHDGQRILLGKPAGPMRIGDIPLVRKPTGEYVLHRVTRKRHGLFYITGDVQTRAEGPFEMKNVVSVVHAAAFGKRNCDTSGAVWRCLSWLWILLLPLRKPLLYFIRKLEKSRNWLLCHWNIFNAP